MKGAKVKPPAPPRCRRPMCPSTAVTYKEEPKYYQCDRCDVIWTIPFEKKVQALHAAGLGYTIRDQTDTKPLTLIED